MSAKMAAALLLISHPGEDAFTCFVVMKFYRISRVDRCWPWDRHLTGILICVYLMTEQFCSSISGVMFSCCGVVSVRGAGLCEDDTTTLVLFLQTRFESALVF